ncbi:MAG: hypothetical protein PHV48_04885 [Candidatus Omnitrophica bacterium]|nr:hypothetical protein [Candidatus Omnitrophota bacterium]
MSKFVLRRVIIILLIITVTCPGVCYAGGLRTGFGKVILENVPIGKAYSMRRDSKFPLVIKNESDERVNLKLEVLIPKEGEVQQGYEPLPDIKWIMLENNSFTVDPNGEAETDVIIDIPDDNQYLGRKFHVFILSCTTGESLGIGLKSKLLFSVGEAKDK